MSKFSDNLLTSGISMHTI